MKIHVESRSRSVPTFVRPETYVWKPPVSIAVSVFRLKMFKKMKIDQPYVSESGAPSFVCKWITFRCLKMDHLQQYLKTDQQLLHAMFQLLKALSFWTSPELYWGPPSALLSSNNVLNNIFYPQKKFCFIVFHLWLNKNEIVLAKISSWKNKRRALISPAAGNELKK